MSLPLFQAEYADRRIVMIPPQLDDTRRAKFLTLVTAAVRQQAKFAEQHENVLRVTGEVRDRGDRLIIPHEPAAPADPRVLEANDPVPDIRTLWWLSWSLLRGLSAAGATPHGGVQFATVYRDQTGLVKLGDFGIACAYEAVCGIDGRRFVHCDGLVRTTAEGHACSGVWDVLDEEEEREFGWIVPFFGHELLSGSQRLNPKSDQFSLGVLLYQIGLGAHPYNVPLSDPILAMYYQLDPLDPRDERDDWKTAFEHQDSDIAGPDDVPIIQWAELVQRLVHSDPGERLPNFSRIDADMQFAAPEAWAGAQSDLTSAMRKLDDADPEGFLELAARWRAEEALPDLWRAPLTEWCETVEREKGRITQHRRLKQRLREGQQALDSVQLDQARQIIREVLADEICDESLRSAAEELQRLCDEQEEFIQSGADELAKVYLETARDSVARHAYDDARQVLEGLLGDPATPGSRAEQARQILADIELAELNIELQRAELTGAKTDFRRGRLDAAHQRVQTVLEQEGVPEDTAAAARELLTMLDAAIAVRSEATARQREAQDAWARLDLDAMQAAIDRFPADADDPKIAEALKELTALAEGLRDGLTLRGDAEAALEGDPGQALRHARRGRQLETIPEELRGVLASLADRAEAAFAERKQARIDGVLADLDAAEIACDSLDIDECRRLLAIDVIDASDFPPETVERITRLRGTCDRIEQVRQNFDAARELADANQFVESLQKLDEPDVAGLPETLGRQLEQWREEVRARRDVFAERERGQLALLLKQADEAIDAQKFTEAAQALDAVDVSVYATDELRTQSEVTRARLDKWHAAFVAERKKRRALERATAALRSAEQALECGNVTVARNHLSEITDTRGLDDDLVQRHRELNERVAALAVVDEIASAISARIAQRDYVGALAALEDTKGDRDISLEFRSRLQILREQAERGLAQQRGEVDKQIDQLRDRVEKLRWQAGDVATRLAAVRDDPVAAQEQQQQATELIARFEALPQRRPLPMPAIAAVIAVVVIGGGLAAYLGLSGSTPDETSARPTPEPAPIVTTQPHQTEAPPHQTDAPPPVDYAVAIEQGLDRLQGELAAAAERAATAGRVIHDWTLTFEPPDAVPTELIAVSPEASERRAIARAESVAQLRELRLTPEITDALYPLPERSEEDRVREQLASVQDRMQHEIDERRARLLADGASPPEYTLEFDPPDAFPSELFARPAAGAPESVHPVRLATVEAGALASLAVTDAWSARLFPIVEPVEPVEPPPPQHPPLEQLASAYLGAIRAALPEANVSEELLPAEDGTFELVISWGNREFPPIRGIRLNTEAGAFEPPPETIVAPIQPQIAALQALGEPIAIELPAGLVSDLGGQRATLRVITPIQDVGLRGVDVQARSVDVEAQVQLAGDPRGADATFALAARYSNDGLAVSETTAGEFERTYRELQQSRLDESVAEVARVLEFPAGMQVAGPTDFSGGPTAALIVRSGEQTLTTLGASWQTERFRYELDPPVAREAVRAALRDSAGQPTTLTQLKQTWPAFRERVAPVTGQLGAAYVRGCDIAEIGVSDAQTGAGYDVPVGVAVAPAGGTDAGAVRFAAAIALRDGAWQWNDADTRAAQSAVAQSLANLARNEAFMQPRRRAAVEDLARELGVSASSLDAQTSDGRLTVATTEAGRQTRYTWTWDASRFEYANRSRSVQAPPSLDQRLAQYAGASSVDAGAFAEVLREVTQKKIARFGTGQYVVSDALGAGGQAGLQRVSADVQRMVAPNPAGDPFPTVFIEFYASDADVYALSWHATTSASDDIVGVEQLRVTRVMPASQLRSYSDPAAFRAVYRQDADLGDRLLGAAIGSAISGSGRPGGGSFGVMIAPDGLLWLARWEQVRFRSRPVQQLDWRKAEPASSATSMRDVLKPKRQGSDSSEFARAGIWCVPTLTGQWRGAGDKVDTFNLGVLVTGKGAAKARFRQSGSVLLSSIVDPTLTGDFNWPNFARQVGVGEIGYRFWQRGWENGAWDPTPFTSFSLIQTP